MFAIQAVNGATSRFAFAMDAGRTTTSTHYTARRGQENCYELDVEPGTGNIYVAGWRNTQPSEDSNTPGGASANHYSRRAILLKLDRMGNILWIRELSKDGMKNDPVSGQTWTRVENFSGVCINPLTGDVYVVGSTTSMEADHYNWASPRANDCLVAKYSSSGTLLWQKFYGRNYFEWGSGSGNWYYYSEDRFDTCTPLYDGRFAAAGQTSNNGGSGVGQINSNVMVTVWNSDGSVSWSKWLSIDNTLNNNSSQQGTGTYVSAVTDAVAADGSNNVYALVYKGHDTHMIKFNSSGTVQWKKYWNGSNIGSASSIKVTKSGDIYVGVGGNPAQGGSGVMKFNTNGVLQWSKRLPTVSYLENATFDEHGNFWVHSQMDGEYVCINSSGNVVRSLKVAGNPAGAFYSRGFRVHEGYLTALTGGRFIGRNQSNSREQNIGVFQLEVGGVNNGSFTHTNSDNSTTTVTFSTPSHSPNNVSVSVSNSSIIIDNYPSSQSLRSSNGSCTNFTNSSLFHSRTLTI
jgi:hypothetical protein